MVDDSVGGGIVLKNKLFRGSSNSATLFGYTAVKSNGKRCSYNNYGCVESYLSVQGIINTIEKNVEVGNLKSSGNNTLSEIQLIEKVNSLAHNGNASANSLPKEAGGYFGMVLYNSCLLIYPDAMII